MSSAAGEPAAVSLLSEPPLAWPQGQARKRRKSQQYQAYTRASSRRSWWSGG